MCQIPLKFYYPPFGFIKDLQHLQVLPVACSSVSTPIAHYLQQTEIIYDEDNVIWGEMAGQFDPTCHVKLQFLYNISQVYLWASGLTELQLLFDTKLN